MDGWMEVVIYGIMIPTPGGQLSASFASPIGPSIGIPIMLAIISGGGMSGIPAIMGSPIMPMPKGAEAC